MAENKDSLDLWVTEMLQNNYIPSESERKKVLVCYFLLWIVIFLNKGEITKYEIFHLRQSIWWWTVFFLFFIVSMIFIFIPFIKIIPILLFIAIFILWVVFVKQAWEWKYVVEINWEKKVLAPFFVWLGNWILELFDVKFKVK